LREAELFRELRVEPELRTTSIDEEGDFVPAIHAHVDDGQRASVHEFEAGLLAITVQLVRRLALEAPQLRDIQCRVLGDDQFVAAHVDAVERRCRPLEIVAAIKRLGQHDLGVSVTWMQRDGLLQPFFRIIEAIGQQCNAAQSKNCLEVFGVLSGDLRVDIASFGELPGLEELIGRINVRRPRLRFRLFSKTAMRDDQGKRDANADMSHLDSQSKLSRDQTILRH